MPDPLRQLFHLLERTPWTTSVGAPSGPDEDARPDATSALATFPTEGVGVVRGLLSRRRTEALTAALCRVEELGLPPVFVYALDAFWEPLGRLVPIVEELIGPAEVLADGWAWNIPPRSGLSGWAPHRGVYEPLRQSDGRPSVVNVWIALSDVTVDTACMHVVPLTKDPGYPDALRREPFDVTHARPYPLEAGSALFWDACSLHWGGPMREGATNARTAYSLTLRAREAPGLEGLDAVKSFEKLSLHERLELVAVQILRYGSLAEVPRPVVDWAGLLGALRERHGPVKNREGEHGSGGTPV